MRKEIMRPLVVYLSLFALGGQCAGAAGEEAPVLKKSEIRMDAEGKVAREMLRSAVLHIFEPTAEFQEFRKKNPRPANVVETSSLEFLKVSGGSAQAFIETNSRKESYKKPAHAPLSFIVFLKLRTAEDVFTIQYLRLHDRTFDIEIDQISPKAAPEVKSPLLAIIEVPLGSREAGPFHYSVNFNAGIHKRGTQELPEGWEFSDVNRLSSLASGCTIVDSKIDPSTKPEVPIRKSGDFTEGQIDQAIESLQRVTFPASREKVYAAAGLGKGADERVATFGGSRTAFTTTHSLTSGPDGYILQLRSKRVETPGFPEIIESATLFRRENERRAILFDSRITREY